MGLYFRNKSVYIDSFNSSWSLLRSSESARGTVGQSTDGKMLGELEVPTVPTLAQERKPHSISLCSV